MSVCPSEKSVCHKSDDGDGVHRISSLILMAKVLFSSDWDEGCLSYQ